MLAPLPQLDTIRIAVIGLGYVGLPLLIAFSKRYNAIGFDINPTRIESCKKALMRQSKSLRKRFSALIAPLAAHFVILQKQMSILFVCLRPLMNTKSPTSPRFWAQVKWQVKFCKEAISLFMNPPPTPPARKMNAELCLSLPHHFILIAIFIFATRPSG